MIVISTEWLAVGLLFACVVQGALLVGIVRAHNALARDYIVAAAALNEVITYLSQTEPDGDPPEEITPPQASNVILFRSRKAA